MNDDARRILRECAVDLIRASDLDDTLAVFRLGTVMNQLRELQSGMLTTEPPALVAYMERVA